MNDQDLTQLSIKLGNKLHSKAYFITTAESCTGGGIAEAITRIAGSSAWFAYGFVSYSNEAKHDLLGVDAEMINAQGAVSEATVKAMVAGAVSRSDADIGVAVSGIAGPDGGSADKPVGTVWIAWQRRDDKPVAQCFHFEGDRDAVRRQTVYEALTGTLALL